MDQIDISHVDPWMVDLKGLLRNAEFSDAFLVIDQCNQKIRVPVHRNILAIRSCYFRQIFTTLIDAQKPFEVEVPDTTEGDLLLFLEYMYTGTVSLNVETALFVLNLARRFYITKLSDAIMDFLTKALTTDTFDLIYNHALTSDCSRLIDTCLEFCDENTDEVLQDCTLVTSLSLSALTNIISRSSLCPSSEMIIFEFVHQWIIVNKSTDEVRLFKAIQRYLDTIDDDSEGDKKIAEVFEKKLVLSNSVQSSASARGRSNHNGPDCSKWLSVQSSTSNSVSCLNLGDHNNDDHDHDGQNGNFTLYENVKDILSDLTRGHHYPLDVIDSQQDLRSLMKCIRLEDIDRNMLLSRVKSSGFVSHRSIMKVLSMDQTDLFYEPCRAKNGLYCAMDRCKVIQGDMADQLVLSPKKAPSKAFLKGLAVHKIGAQIENGELDSILIQLDGLYKINHIQMILWDRYHNSYCYYIQTSTDGKEWRTVIDYTKYHCRGNQTLYFSPKIAKLIKIVGTFTTGQDQYFRLVGFEAGFSTDQITLVPENIIKPSSNVAILKTALIIQGDPAGQMHDMSGQLAQAAINGMVVYTTYAGFTEHKIGDNSIVVQFNQPFLLERCGLLLYAKDYSLFGYKIKSSLDNVNWTVLADKSEERCRAWQSVEFDKPTVCCYLKIVGTHSTKSSWFRLVHIESPPSP